MKTTIEISDALLADAKRQASLDHVTLRTLFESALRRELQARRRSAQPFRLRRATFRGRGLNPELTDLRWDAIRDLIYEKGRK